MSTVLPTSDAELPPGTAVVIVPNGTCVMVGQFGEGKLRTDAVDAGAEPSTSEGAEGADR